MMVTMPDTSPAVRIEYETLCGPAFIEWRRCLAQSIEHTRRTASCDGLHDADLARRMRKVLTSLRKAGVLA